MNSIQNTNLEILNLEKELKPLMERLRQQRSLLSKLESEEFIRVNKITKEDVEFSSDDGKPYFGGHAPLDCC